MSLGLSNLLSAPRDRPFLCVEANPPRGTDVDAVFERFAGLKGVDFVNVTDSALAKMRLSGLSFAALFKQRLGIEPLVNLSCRDRNTIGLQSDLLGAWALGVRSIVALTGDAVTVGDLPDAKGVFEVNSLGLLGLISNLNAGKDLAGVELRGSPAFLPGVVVNPNVRNRDAELRRLVRKRAAGARYALSQPVFDASHALEFFKAASEIGVDMLVGLMPFKSARAAQAMANVPGIKVPESLLASVANAEQESIAPLSMQIALEIAKEVMPYVQGFHVVSGGAPRLAVTLCERLNNWMDELL